MPIFAQVEIRLKPIGPLLDRQLERRERIFRRIMRSAPMRDDELPARAR
jgi:hypothetical protein